MKNLPEKNKNLVPIEFNDFFVTITEKHLTEINEWMPEFNRAISSFGKRNSQTTTSLMSLSMIDAGPYRVLRQILAQVNTKKDALSENIYKLKLKQLKYEELSIDDNLTDIQYKRNILKKSKIEYDIQSLSVYIEGTIKEIGTLKRRYEEVCKNKNIPEQWDEVDFENSEIEHHIKSIFRNAIRDRMQNSHNMGTMEYMEQYGINPIVAYSFVDQYIEQQKSYIVDGKGPDINSYYNFYENMYQAFKDEYKKAAKRIGLDSITQADFLMKKETV